MARFSDRYRVVAGDTRGHGRSEKPPGPYSIQIFTDDWHGALRTIGVKDACIVGFSQGGMIAQLLALQHPEDVGALVLVCTACRSDPTAKDMLEERIRQAQVAGPEAAARLAANGIFSSGFAASEPAAIEEFVRWRAAMNQDALVAATRAAYGFETSPRLHAVRAPSLVVYGEEDKLTPPAVVKLVAAALPGAELAGVPGAGHMIPVEQPQVFEKILASFLDKHYPVDNRQGERR
jgi:pimeloyl-ACP methyl ester carboxylesterase